MENKTIQVWPHVFICPNEVLSKQVSYGVMTIEKKQKVVENGIWDGIPSSGNFCTDGYYSSLKELVENIKLGCEEKGFKNLQFIFDVPLSDKVTVTFHQQKDSHKFTVDLLDRERPLTEEERQEFLRQFTLFEHV